jgi:hypothetical protein
MAGTTDSGQASTHNQYIHKIRISHTGASLGSPVAGSLPHLPRTLDYSPPPFNTFESANIDALSAIGYLNCMGKMEEICAHDPKTKCGTTFGVNPRSSLKFYRLLPGGSLDLQSQLA